MRVLMLGWEFPPYIAGGLGVACHGLTAALDRMGHHVLFVLPTAVHPSASSHVTLLADGGPIAPRADRPRATFATAEVMTVPAPFCSPYPGSSGPIPGEVEVRDRLLGAAERARSAEHEQRPAVPSATAPPGEVLGAAQRSDQYTGDLIEAATSYARRVTALARNQRFDIVHAHDWLTFTAGIAIARTADKPLIVHIHSTEYDRAGEDINPRIHDLERRGMFAADRVIAVSALTKSICVRHYGVNPGKVDVVYNGIDPGGPRPPPGGRIEPRDRIVLFLGRITHQKGPEYFLAAAKQVLERMRDVKFVIAGSGDLAARMIALAAELGIAEHVLFTGFLRGEDVERVFQIADCYVMPSVSEPFGLAALEAVQHGVPVIISRQSGVSEVLAHALKVNFWDTRETADKILAVLKRPALGEALREHSAFELRSLTWDGAARQCLDVYARAFAARGAPMTV
jgi:glycogen(starch) synthase